MTFQSVYVFIGPQGSGKGTQANLLSQRHGFVVLVMGDFLRAEAAKNTENGRRLASLVTQGDLVPDALTFQLLRDALAKYPPETKFIFDGFPRTIQQAKILDTFLPITRAIHIDLPYEISLQRVSGRRICPHGHHFNIYTLPPRVAGRCDHDGLSLERRGDDADDAIKKRLALYEEVTSKVLEYYASQGKLVTIDGHAPITDVAASIEKKLFGHEH